MTTKVRMNSGSAQSEPTRDRRVQKTLGLLHEALGALIREKVYERITVAEILGRPNIGRSTFYTHFRPKDGSIGELLHSAQSTEQAVSASAPERMVAFSLPFLEHIQRHRRRARRGWAGEVARYFMR